jgi:hypothetical protein
MGKKSRIKREHRLRPAEEDLGLEEVEPIHDPLTLPALAPIEEENQMTAAFQMQIRQSPLWSKMVRELGPEQAEDFLEHLRIKINTWNIQYPLDAQPRRSP